MEQQRFFSKAQADSGLFGRLIAGPAGQAGDTEDQYDPKSRSTLE